MNEKERFHQNIIEVAKTLANSIQNVAKSINRLAESQEKKNNITVEQSPLWRTRVGDWVAQIIIEMTNHR